MIETTIPEINVTELMERVRREAARIESNREHAAAAPVAGATLPLPKIAVRHRYRCASPTEKA